MSKRTKSPAKSTTARISKEPEMQKLKKKYPNLFGFIDERFKTDNGFGLTLTIGVIISFIFAFFFFSIVEDLISNEPLIKADIRLINLLQIFRTAQFNKIMLFITCLGNWQIIFPAVVLLSLLFILSKNWRYFAALLVSVVSGEAFVWIVKNTVQRPRPLLINSLIQENSFSFPSGHALVAVSFYGLLTYFLFKASKYKLQKIISVISGISFILGIGFSRIYLGVHWPSDVLASYAAGMALVISLITALEIKKEPGAISLKLNKMKSKAIMLLGIFFFILWCGYLVYFFNTHSLQTRTITSPQQIILSSWEIPEGFFVNFPKTSEDVVGNPIEPINFIFIGSKEKVTETFEKAKWTKTDQISLNSTINLIKTTLLHEPYPQAPGLPSFWNARPNDFAYERPSQKKTINERNHIHFWKTPFIVDGQEVWFATAHFDMKIAFEPNVFFVTHIIDPNIDKEREKIKEDILITGNIKTIKEFSIVEANLGSNANGSPFFTDGKAEIIFLN